VGISNQITLLIFQYISSRLVTLFKVTDAITQVSDIFDLTVVFKLINFSLQMYLLFVPEMSTSSTSYICVDYIHCFGLDPVTAAIQPASLDQKIVNILHQTKVYAASVHTEQHTAHSGF